MDIYTRLENLEKLVDELIKMINKSKMYTDSDISGVRQTMSEFEKTVFPDWIPNGHEYLVSERVSYNGGLYRCIQGHKSQADWTPDTAVSLWVSISDPTEEYPEWIQPAGAHDAYEKGDKVSHLDKHWISDIDANVYEPSIYGWSEVE
jgi:hypothetical protein